MDLIKVVKFEEEEIHKQLITKFIAEMIYIHYKYFGNKKFDSYAMSLT